MESVFWFAVLLCLASAYGDKAKGKGEDNLKTEEIDIPIGDEDDGEIKVDQGVLVLKEANFQRAIEENELILVEFYAPWCMHCISLAPEYVKAAKTLKESGSPVKLAKVDATENTKLTADYNIGGYPTLKLFKHGEPIDYHQGVNTADAILAWLEKQTGPPARVLSSIADVGKYQEENKEGVAVIGFFKSDKSDAAKEYFKVAQNMDDYPFAVVVNNDAVFSLFKIKKDSVIVLRQPDYFFESERAITSDLKEEAIVKFLKEESKPLIFDYNMKNAQKDVGGSDVKNHLILFISKENGQYSDKFLGPMREAAKDFKGRVLFVTVNTDDTKNTRISDFFGLIKDQLKKPRMRLVKMGEQDGTAPKYKPKYADEEKVFQSAKITGEFLDGFFSGSVKQYYNAQPTPKNWDKGPVKILTAHNFDEIVFSKKKTVLVEFVAPWCSNCKDLEPDFDALAEKFRDEIVVGRIDTSLNELPHTKVTQMPTVNLYKKGDNHVVTFNGEVTLKRLTAFVESGGESYGVDDAEEVQGEDGDLKIGKIEL